MSSDRTESFTDKNHSNLIMEENYEKEAIEIKKRDYDDDNEEEYNLAKLMEHVTFDNNDPPSDENNNNNNKKKFLNNYSGDSMIYTNTITLTPEKFPSHVNYMESDNDTAVSDSFFHNDEYISGVYNNNDNDDDGKEKMKEEKTEESMINADRLKESLNSLHDKIDFMISNFNERKSSFKNETSQKNYISTKEQVLQTNNKKNNNEIKYGFLRNGKIMYIGNAKEENFGRVVGKNRGMLQKLEYDYKVDISVPSIEERDNFPYILIRRRRFDSYMEGAAKSVFDLLLGKDYYRS